MVVNSRSGLPASAASSASRWRILVARKASQLLLCLAVIALVTILLVPEKRWPRRDGEHPDGTPERTHAQAADIARRSSATPPALSVPSILQQQIRTRKKLIQQIESSSQSAAPPLVEQVPRQVISTKKLARDSDLAVEQAAQQTPTSPPSISEAAQDVTAVTHVDAFATPVEDTFTSPSYENKLGDYEKEDTAVYRKARDNLMQDKFLILAVASNGNLDFTQNWVTSLRRTGHSRYLVMCLDILICARLDPEHSALVPRHWLQSEIDSSPVLYGTAEYVSLVQSKTLVVIKFLKMGFTVLFSDVDIVWMSRGIVPYLEFMMKDNTFREAIFSIEQTHDSLPSVNTGFWFAKPTPTIVQLFDRTIHIQLKRNVTQQYAFNAAMKAAELRSSPKIAYLDKTLFPNGWVFFKERLHEMTGIRPLIVHANYMRGSETKRQSLREAGIWLLDEDEEEEEPEGGNLGRERAGGLMGLQQVETTDADEDIVGRDDAAHGMRKRVSLLAAFSSY